MGARSLTLRIGDDKKLGVTLTGGAMRDNSHILDGLFKLLTEQVPIDRREKVLRVIAEASSLRSRAIWSVIMNDALGKYLFFFYHSDDPKEAEYVARTLGVPFSEILKVWQSWWHVDPLNQTRQELGRKDFQNRVRKHIGYVPTPQPKQHVDKHGLAYERRYKGPTLEYEE